jgi:predicted Zn-dependent protease with MMP-like domain
MSLPKPLPLPAPESLAPSLDQIEGLARDAVFALPEPYRQAATAIVLRIEDFAADDLLDLMEVTDPFALTGLYDGTPLTEKSVLDQVTGPDVIWLFRRPILDEWAARGDVTLAELVTHVLVHELAHHFGWSDEDIASVDPWWE